MDTEYLKRRGYCITSRQYQLASRIDDENWQDHCKDADLYRRVKSKDTVRVTKKQLSELKNSSCVYTKFRK